MSAKKRKTTSISNSPHIPEKVRRTEGASVFDRRRKEIFEIVCKENELCRASDRSRPLIANNDKDFEYNTSSSEGDDEIEIKNRLGNVDRTKNLERLNEIKVLHEARVTNAINILTADVKTPSKKLTADDKRMNTLKRNCHKNTLKHDAIFEVVQETEHTWDSPMYLVKCIRASILTRDWDSLTNLLLLLLDFQKGRDKRYISYAKQAASLNFTYNSAGTSSDMRKKFQEMYSLNLR